MNQVAGSLYINRESFINHEFQFKESLFKINSPFEPTGDQPQAIDYLVKGVEAGAKHQVMLGVTGSGKTFTMANIIAKIGKPALVIAPNKTLAKTVVQRIYISFSP